MRANGLANFPDSALSVNDGQVKVDIPGYIKREPDFRSATQACQRDLPGSGSAAKHVSIQAERVFAKCMRSHGVTDFPDPMPGGGFNIPGNTNSRQFDTANDACKAKLSGKR